jgi:hypothetical protein
VLALDVDGRPLELFRTADEAAAAVLDHATGLACQSAQTTRPPVAIAVHRIAVYSMFRRSIIPATYDA